ncbi:hypothetical protein PSPO01_06950 [Paraphaeosphaeria sporulosa]
MSIIYSSLKLTFTSLLLSLICSAPSFVA